MREFSGKVAVITGTSGMGLAAALRLARDGARVHLLGVDATANAAAVEALAPLGGTVHACDVAQDDQVAQAIAAVVAHDGGIDIVVNAAGIQTYGDLETTTPDQWDRVMGVNLRGTYLVSHFCWPHMLGRGRGTILHISSVQGHANQHNVLGYATTKGAVHAMTRALAVDCARHGVTVNSISPGSVRTPLLEYGAGQIAQAQGRTLADVMADFGRGHPVGRIGEAEEVADLVAFLCSDQARFITGADIRIDGGLTSWLGV
jgi:meso-butanediol dehydrogenase / (S,S)-butanediol dehydrogenase / diacetyl reductase